MTERNAGPRPGERDADADPTRTPPREDKQGISNRPGDADEDEMAEEEEDQSLFDEEDLEEDADDEPALGPAPPRE